jgi:elongation factor 1-gamma
MTFGKIYASSKDGRAQKSLLAAEYNGLELETTPDFQFGVSNKEASYLEKFPLGQTPAFEGADGLLLTESGAILYHVAQAKKDTTLLGKNPNELAKIWQLILFTESSLIHPPSEIVKANWTGKKLSEEVEKDQFEALFKYLEYLNNFIGSNTYLVGDTISIADINLVCNLNLVYGYVINAEHRAKYSKLTKYYENILNFPEFKKIVGEVKYQHN